MKILKFFYRKPDFIVQRKDGYVYMRRWWVIPRNKRFNIYLHEFINDDDDRALHTHPWASLSILLRGSYKEHLPGGEIKIYKAPALIYRNAAYAHRIELFKDFGLREIENKLGNHLEGYMKPLKAWTIFITGKKIQEWGFLCPKGWVHQEIFEKNNGCGE